MPASTRGIALVGSLLLSGCPNDDSPPAPGTSLESTFLASRARFREAGAHLWSLRPYAGKLDTIRTRVGARGDVFLAGVSSESINLGGRFLHSQVPGSPNVFLASFSKDGAHLWSRSVSAMLPRRQHCLSLPCDDTQADGGAEAHGIAAMAMTPANETLLAVSRRRAGGTLGTSLVKVSARGELLWERWLDCAEEACGVLALSAESSGGYRLLLELDRALLHSQRNRGSQEGGEVLLVRLSSAGESLDLVRIGMAPSVQVRGFVELPGAVVIGGSFSGKARLAGALRKSRGGSDGFLLAVSEDGRNLWTTTLSGSGAEEVSRLAAGPEGEIVLAGRFDGALQLGDRSMSASGAHDAFLARYRRGEGFLEVVQLGGPGVETVQGLAVDAEGRIFAGGLFEPSVAIDEEHTSSGGTDGFTLRIEGEERELRSFGGSEDDEVQDLSLLLGSELISGRFGETVDLGGGALVSEGANAFWARLRL